MFKMFNRIIEDLSDRLSIINSGVEQNQQVFEEAIQDIPKKPVISSRRDPITQKEYDKVLLDVEKEINSLTKPDNPLSLVAKTKTEIRLRAKLEWLKNHVVK